MSACCPVQEVAKGDETPVAEVSLFGETVESEAVKRRREDLEVAELDLRLAEVRMRVKKTRVEGVGAAMEAGMQALQRLGAPVDDRNRARAKDLIDTAMFEDETRDHTGDKELCIRSFLQTHGIRDATMDYKLGRAAKHLLLKDNPDFTFRKKTIHCNGQLLEANVWTESMKPYLQRALTQLTDLPGQRPNLLSLIFPPEA